MSEWIRVKDRLPEVDTVVWIHTKSGEMMDASLSSTHSWNGAGLSVGYWGDGEAAWFSKEDVTHWMPLPEPPAAT